MKSVITSMAIPPKEGAQGDAAKPLPLVTVDEVLVDVAIRPLLSGKAVVNHVAVTGFSVRAKRDADGTLHLPPIPVGEAPAPAAPASTESAAASARGK